MNKCIPIFIIHLILIGCQSQFEMPEEGNGCPEAGIAKSHINATNFYQYQYYQIDENSPCQRRQCLNGQWIGDSEYSCPNSCIELGPDDDPTTHDYCGNCLNESERCDGYLAQKCKDGEWDTQIDCAAEFGTSCVKIDDKATCGACDDNSPPNYFNQNNICQRSICINAHWEYDEDFSCFTKDDINKLASCNSTLTGCGECLSGNMKCEGKDIYTCIAGSWTKDITPCIFSCSKVDNEEQYICGKCDNSSKKEYWNHLDNNMCVSTICQNGQRIDNYECLTGSCVFGDDGEFISCGECFNGVGRCDDKHYQICQNGKFKSLLTCDSCENNICIKSCTELNKCTQGTDTIATFCNSDGQIEFCPAGCTSDNICMNCQDGEQIFKEEDDICFYRTCNNNLYPEAYTKCIDTNNKGVSCIKDNNNQFSCGECKNGSKKCEQTASSCTCQICQNGQWTKLCTNNYSCKGTADNYSNCGECTNSNSDYYYQEGTTCYHKKCSNGTWSPVQKCNNNNSCTGTAGKYNNCGECINGKKYNVTEASGLCNYRECSAGKLGAIQRCPNGVSCNKARTDCGVCYNKKTKCEQGYLFTCTDGAWPAKGTFCPKGCHSSGEKCKP